MDIEYCIKKSCILLDGTKYDTYGIVAIERHSETVKSEFDDVSLDKHYVVELAKLLNSSKVELCHFKEVITDELNR